MILKLRSKETGEMYRAIKWDGKNEIELRQFGVTGTKEGRQTKIDCRHNLYVKQNGLFVKVSIDNYILQHGIVYQQITADKLNKNFNVVEE